MKREKLLWCFSFLGAFFMMDYTANAEIIHDYQVEIELFEDGSAEVVEKIHYDFEDYERRGIIRDLPVFYGSGMDSVEIPVEVLSVTNENDEPYEYLVTDYDWYKEVRIGNPDVYLSGEHWYYISYKMLGVMNSFDTHDELYLNAIGTDWDVQIENAEVVVKLPGDGSIGAACYKGYFGSSNTECTAEVRNGQEFYFASNGILQAYEGLTIVAGAEKHLIVTPAILKVDGSPAYSDVYLNEEFYGGAPGSFRIAPGSYEMEIRSNFTYLPRTEKLTISEGETQIINYELERSNLYKFFNGVFGYIFFGFGFLLLLLNWFRKGRDPKGSGIIMTIYESPKLDKRNLTAGEIGLLVDQKADLHDITASIIELANKGYLKIIKGNSEVNDKWGGAKRNAYTFEKLTPEIESNLLPFEKNLIEKLFKSGNKIELSKIQDSFYVGLNDLKKDLYTQGVKNNFFDKNPDDAIGSAMGWSIVYLIVLLIAGFFLLVNFDGPSLWLVPAVGVVGLFFAASMAKRSKLGVEYYEKVLGLKNFLTATEKDRLKVLFRPEEYEDVFAKFLPFAIVLEVEKDWAKQFEDLYKGVPKWFEGSSNLTTFMRDFQAFRASAEKSYKYVKPTVSSGGRSGWGGGSSGGWSGGSGFSGGSSGGGFGGGGGRSW